MKYVVDASVAVKWYVPEVHSVEAERVLDPANELHAPDLIVPEFGNILWKKIGRGELTEVQARKIIEAFIVVPINKYSASPLLEAAFAGAVKSSRFMTGPTWRWLSRSTITRG
jgi:predicted nucleic acid-binding protein